MLLLNTSRIRGGTYFEYTDIQYSTVRGANPTLYARKKLSGLIKNSQKFSSKKKRGGSPAHDAEHQNYLILDHYYIYFWRPCPCAQGRVGSSYFAYTFI